MAEGQTSQPAAPATPGLRGVRRMVYWAGRLLQGIGLIVLWWVLLLFASVTGMAALLVLSGMGVVIFLIGWACTAWVRQGGELQR